MKFRRSGKKNVETNAQLTGDMKAVKKYIRANKPEVKHVDIALNAQSISNAGFVQSLNGSMVQGTAENQRIGAGIHVKKLHICGSFTSADSSNELRVIVVRDKSSDGAQPLTTDILEALDPKSPIKWVNRKRFEFLFDKYHAAVSISDMPMQYRKTLKGGDKLTTWLDNTGTATGYGQNQYYLFLITDSAAPAHPISNFYIRFEYEE